MSSSSAFAFFEIPFQLSKVGERRTGRPTGNAKLLSGGKLSLVEDALAVLRAVFDSIPTFWGSSELASVFRLYCDGLALGSKDEIGSFARRVASKAPTNILLSTYFEIWPLISCQAGVSLR
jgi:hypothetical protein